MLTALQVVTFAVLGTLDISSAFSVIMCCRIVKYQVVEYKTATKGEKKEKLMFFVWTMFIMLIMIGITVVFGLLTYRAATDASFWK